MKHEYGRLIVIARDTSKRLMNLIENVRSFEQSIEYRSDKD